VKSVDSFGRLPLHHACFHNASQETLQFLLNAYPEAVEVEDNWGFIPCIPVSRDIDIEVNGVSIPVEETSVVLGAVEAQQRAFEEMHSTGFEQIMLCSELLNSNDTNEIECALSIDREKSLGDSEEELFESLDYKELFENCDPTAIQDQEDIRTVDVEEESLNEPKECINEELETVLTKHALEIAAFEKLIDIVKEKSTNYGRNKTENRDDYVENYPEYMKGNFEGLEDQLLKIVDSYEELMEMLQSQKTRILDLGPQDMELRVKCSELITRAEDDSKTISRLHDVVDSQNIEYEQKMDEVDMIVEKFEEQKERYIQLYEQYKLTANKLAEAEMMSNESNTNHSVSHEESSTAKLEDELKQLREHYVELEKEYNAVSLRAKSLEETVKKSKASTNNGIETSFKQRYEEEKMKSHDMVVKLRFANSQVILLENEVHEYSRRNVDVEKMKAASMHELDYMMKDNHRLQQDLSLNSSVISLFKVKAKEDNNRIATLEESITILKDTLVAQKTKYKNIYYEQVSAQIEILRQELETEKSKNSELQRQNAYITAKLSDIEYIHPRGNGSESSSHMNKMEKMYNNLKDNYEKAVSQTTSLEEQVNKYRKELLELKKSKVEFEDKAGRELQRRNTNYSEQESGKSTKSQISQSIERDDIDEMCNITSNGTNNKSGRDDTPSDRCADVVHSSRTPPISELKRIHSSNTVKVISCNIHSTKGDDGSSSSELFNVSSKSEQKLCSSDIPLVTSSSSDMSASQNTIYGVSLRRTQGGIYD